MISNITYQLFMDNVLINETDCATFERAMDYFYECNFDVCNQKNFKIKVKPKKYKTDYIKDEVMV
jgi:hypothetical protein